VEDRWKIKIPLPPRKHQYTKVFSEKCGRWKRNDTKISMRTYLNGRCGRFEVSDDKLQAFDKKRAQRALFEKPPRPSQAVAVATFTLYCRNLRPSQAANLSYAGIL
jgi:hypothetical protein